MTDGVTTTISHYSFGGLRIAVKRGSTLYHLHGDHFGSASLTTAGSAVEASRAYYAYGAERAATGDLKTDRTFTGQKSDATGLLYYNARYYDPALGTFISPDSIVPNPARLIDYNRFLYARGNPIKYTDPSGSYSVDSCPGYNPIFGCFGGVPYRTPRWLSRAALPLPKLGPRLGLLGSAARPWLDKAPAAGDVAQSVTQNATQAHSSTQSGGEPADPGGLDPKDPIEKGMETLQRMIDSPKNYFWAKYGQQAHHKQANYYRERGMLQSVHATGKGTIDLILKNNTGVEVKYWQATTVLSPRGITSLAKQMQGFNDNLPHLTRIRVEFVQTANNPVT